MSAEDHNPSINANVSLKRKTLKIIDKYRLGHGYPNRSAYIQDLVNRDLDFGRFEFITDLMSMNIFPLITFFMFLIVFVLSGGMLFLMFMLICGIFAMWFTIMYVKKHGKVRKKNKRG